MIFNLSDANLVGMVAVIITVLALIRRSNHGFLLLMGLGVSFWTLHYWLLGTIPGTAIHGIAAVSIFVAHGLRYSPLALRLGTGIVFSSLGVSAAIIFGSGLADVVAAVGCVVMTLCQFVARGMALRLGFLVGEILFFIFAALVGSIPGMLVTSSNFVAGIFGLWRMWTGSTKTTRVSIW